MHPNEKLIRKYFKAIEEVDLPTISELFHDDFQHILPDKELRSGFQYFFPEPGKTELPKSDKSFKERVLEGFAKNLKIWTEQKFELSNFICEETRVAFENHRACTHSGDWNGLPPTNKRLLWRSMVMAEIKDGKIYRWNVLVDHLLILRQLNLIYKEQENILLVNSYINKIKEMGIID
ncbi:MAG: ester cyclase [Candidatus Heimdallarchaeota archaeon]|nr:ester cyclase [Candidatus Heimdallarchaeota archaeon]